jgi:uncharacterized protein YecT (DUF1311 family)
MHAAFLYARVAVHLPPMRLLLLLAALIPILLSAEGVRAQAKATPTSIIPEGWLPALAPSISSTLEQLKEANAQMEMNRLSRLIADMTDAQLFVAYVRLYEKLPPNERTALVAEQAKWLKARVKAAAEGIESGGGSLAPLEANNAEVTFTEKRLAELRARLKTTETGKKKKTKSADADE